VASLENLIRRWVVERVQPATPSAESVFVIGLGRFGVAVATTLMELDVDVMAIDTDPKLVDRWADRLTHVRIADGTSSEALKQLGVTDFDAAVVAIGTGIESSILTTAALVDLKVEKVWAKAITNEHGRILERVGAHHVVFPEREMGERVAHVVTGQVTDYFQIDDDFVLAELNVPSRLVGQTLAESEIRQSYAVTVVCVKPEDSAYTYATSDSLLTKGDTLLVAGEVANIERFTEFASNLK